MKKTRAILLTVMFGLSLVFLLEMNYLRGVPSGSAAPKNLYLLEAVIRLIRNDYLEEKDPLQTMDGSFKGLVNSLDGQSSYLDAENTARYLEQQGTPLKGPGVIVLKRFGAFPQIVGIIEGTPAEKQGLQIGDLVTEINGRATPEMSLVEVNVRLYDKNELPLGLKVLRDEKTIDIKVDRIPLSPQPVSYSEQEGVSGILKVARMSPPSVNTIKTEVFPRLRDGKKPLIVDLRNCAEGDYEEARQFINLFLKTDSIGYFEKKGAAKEILASSEEPLMAKLPLIIWTNAGTIGPAETAAGVLKEFGRAKLVGLPTPGLTAKHEQFPLEDGSSVLLTSGIFFLNSGRAVWGEGVEPDVRVDAEDQSFKSFLEKTRPLLSAS
jgi:carboxyl-terminal processing protease